jgi:hypothetical protein
VKPADDRGYTSLQILLLLGLMSVLALGLAIMVSQAMAPVRSIRDDAEALALLARFDAEFQDAYRKDPTPDADSPFDLFWRMDGRTVDGWTLGLEDVSSFVNLNWVNTALLENSSLGRRLVEGRTWQELKQHREETGYVLDLESAYRDFFSPEDCRLLFSPWGAANINISYEECLEDLYRFRLPGIGDPGGFRAAVDQHLLKQKLWTQPELEGFLGVDGPHILPFINAMPSLNVNFTNPTLLGAVLAYPYPTGGLPNPAGLRDGLLAARADHEITPDQLWAAVGIASPQQERTKSWLGTRTAVWRLSISREGRHMEHILHSPAKEKTMD